MVLRVAAWPWFVVVSKIQIAAKWTVPVLLACGIHIGFEVRCGEPAAGVILLFILVGNQDKNEDCNFSSRPQIKYVKAQLRNNEGNSPSLMCFNFGDDM